MADESDALRWLRDHDRLNDRIEEVDRDSEERDEQLDDRIDRVDRKLEGDDDDPERYPGIDRLVMDDYRRRRMRSRLVTVVGAILASGLLATLIALFALVQSLISGGN